MRCEENGHRTPAAGSLCVTGSAGLERTVDRVNEIGVAAPPARGGGDEECVLPALGGEPTVVRPQRAVVTGRPGVFQVGGGPAASLEATAQPDLVVAGQ